jgi:hypothetical protein
MPIGNLALDLGNIAMLGEYEDNVILIKGSRIFVDF